MCSPGGSAADRNITAESNDKEEELLKLYQQSFDDDLVDLDLIMDLLHYICSTSSDGELSGLDHQMCLTCLWRSLSKPVSSQVLS